MIYDRALGFRPAKLCVTGNVSERTKFRFNPLVFNQLHTTSWTTKEQFSFCQHHNQRFSRKNFDWPGSWFRPKLSFGRALARNYNMYLAGIFQTVFIWFSADNHYKQHHHFTKQYVCRRQMQTVDGRLTGRMLQLRAHIRDGFGCLRAQPQLQVHTYTWYDARQRINTTN